MADPLAAPPATSELEARLSDALRRSSLTLDYQPVVTLPSADPVGVEALARWTDPVLGSVPPDVFIPVAERTGLIHELGGQVLHDACATAAAWSAAGTPVTLAVNVSPLQLANAGFVGQVSRVVDETGLDPRLLVLEITESAAVDDLDETAARLHALRGLGVRVALDDFGVGHSPLSLLQRLPLDILKVDRSFVAHVHENARDAVVVRLLIDTAHAIGLTVCGEGVEDREQARQLVALGCDSAQGWYFGRPTDSANLLGRHLGTAPRASHGVDVGEPAPIQIGSDELITIATPDARVVYASPGALAVLGYTPSDLIGSSMAEHLHPDEVDEILRSREPERGQLPSVRVHRARHRDGSYRWFTTRAQLIRDGNGRPTQVVSTSRDVTAQIEAEQQLASTEATMRWAFDQSPLGLALSRFDGTIVRTNEAFAQMLGYRPSELVGVTVADLTAPDERGTDDKNVLKLLEGGEGHHPPQWVDKHYLHADGHPVAATVWATRLDDEDGHPAYVVAHILPQDRHP